MKSTNTYSTSDTALAAWLISQGFELSDLDNSRPNSIAFLFEDGNSESIGGAVRTFQLGTAEGNILAFFRAYKQLLLKIKDSHGK